MDKLKNKKNMIIGLIVLVVLLALTGGVAVAAGVRNTINAWINVPQEVLEEDLGIPAEGQTYEKEAAA